jgi:hypothetical protein
MSTWTRHRFHANADDYRPITFPPPGPYWCSGYGLTGDGELTYATVIAYLPRGADPRRWWPEASNIDSEEHDQITFTDRFPCPEWWNAAQSQPQEPHK